MTGLGAWAAVALAGLAGACGSGKATHRLRRLQRPRVIARAGPARPRPALVRGRQHEAKRRAAAADVCQALASELRAGTSPRPALEAAARGLPEALLVERAAGSVHGDVDRALRAVAAWPGGDGFGMLATLWTVSERTGSGLAGPVSRLAESLREDEELRREVGAQLAGPRATAVLLALLPLLGLALGSALGASPVGVLLGTPAGQACLVVGAALEALGCWWTVRITRAAERA